MVIKNLRENINFYLNIFIISLMIFGGIIYADTNGIWTRAEDVRNGTFGLDENGGNFGFTENVTVDDFVSAKKYCDENMENCFDYDDILALVPFSTPPSPPSGPATSYNFVQSIYLPEINSNFVGRDVKVALDDDNLYVYYYNTSSLKGKIYYFKQDSLDNWNLIQEVDYYDAWGYTGDLPYIDSISATEGTLLLADPSFSAPDPPSTTILSERGGVYVYKVDSLGMLEAQSMILPWNEVYEEDRFAYSMEVHENMAIFSQPSKTYNDFGSYPTRATGKVYVYRYGGSYWSPLDVFVGYEEMPVPNLNRYFSKGDISIFTNEAGARFFVTFEGPAYNDLYPGHLFCSDPSLDPNCVGEMYLYRYNTGTGNWDIVGTAPTSSFSPRAVEASGDYFLTQAVGSNIISMFTTKSLGTMTSVDTISGSNEGFRINGENIVVKYTRLVGSDLEDYWNIYEIDSSTDTINLIEELVNPPYGGVSMDSETILDGDNMVIVSGSDTYPLSINFYRR